MFSELPDRNLPFLARHAVAGFPLGGIHWFGTAAIHSFTKPSVEAAAFLVTENAGRGEELSFPHDAHIKVILETGQAFQPLACPLLLFTGQPLSLQRSR